MLFNKQRSNMSVFELCLLLAQCHKNTANLKPALTKDWVYWQLIVTEIYFVA